MTRLDKVPQVLQESFQAETEIRWGHSWSDHYLTLGQYSGLLWSEKILWLKVMLLQKCTMYTKGCLIPSNVGKGFGKNGNNRVMP